MFQKEHASPNRLIQNIVHTAKTPRAACIGDRGIIGSSTTSFRAKKGVDLNLGPFLIDHGQNHRGLQRCAVRWGSVVRMLINGQGVGKALVLLLKE
jgi:hypothetical protein